MKFRILIFGLFLICNVNADEIADQGLDPIPLPPELPDPIESGESIEPEITIIRRDDTTIEEYRINGFLYMIKVTPVVGPPYYFIDQDGNGTMETRMNDLNREIVPQWVIFSW